MAIPSFTAKRTVFKYEGSARNSSENCEVEIFAEELNLPRNIVRKTLRPVQAKVLSGSQSVKMGSQRKDVIKLYDEHLRTSAMSRDTTKERANPGQLKNVSSYKLRP